jgi:nitrate reductase cytochrome c-type subunit
MQVSCQKSRQQQLTWFLLPTMIFVLFLQVARLVPFLITSLERMQPYASTPSAAAALEAAGPTAIAALMAVLAAGDPTDWPMLPHEVDGYKVQNMGVCLRCDACVCVIIIIIKLPH